MGSFTLLRAVEITLAVGFAFCAVVKLTPAVNKDLHQQWVNDMDLFCTEKHFPLNKFTGFVPRSDTFRKLWAGLYLVSAFYLLFGKSYMKTYCTIALFIATTMAVIFHVDTGITPERSGALIASNVLLLVRLRLG